VSFVDCVFRGVRSTEGRESKRLDFVFKTSRLNRPKGRSLNAADMAVCRYQ